MSKINDPISFDPYAGILVHFVAHKVFACNNKDHVGLLNERESGLESS